MFVLSWPAIYALELTPACQNRCPGCSNIYAQARAPAPTPGPVWARWLAGFAQQAVQIRLTGGEPTLHPDFFDVLAAATGYDAWVTVFTNGRWAQPEAFARRLAGWPRLSGLLVSLHGARAESHEAFTGVRGSFAETVRNIRVAADAGVPVALSTIITRQSCGELADVVALGRGLGVQHVAFNRFLGEEGSAYEPSPAQMRQSVAEIERLVQAGEPVRYGIGMPQCFATNTSEGCLAGVAYAAIDPFGNLHPCLHSPSLIGTLYTASVYDLWHSPSMDAWRRLMPPECAGCAAYAACHGGCRAVIELRKDRRDPLRGTPLTSYMPEQPVRALPSEARPVAAFRLRPESFGYAALGQGQVVALRSEARPLIEACDGRTTFGRLAAEYGQAGLELLGELWDKGMLQL